MIPYARSQNNAVNHVARQTEKEDEEEEFCLFTT